MTNFLTRKYIRSVHIKIDEHFQSHPHKAKMFVSVVSRWIGRIISLIYVPAVRFDVTVTFHWSKRDDSTSTFVTWNTWYAWLTIRKLSLSISHVRHSFFSSLILWSNIYFILSLLTTYVIRLEFKLSHSLCTQVTTTFCLRK